MIARSTLALLRSLPRLLRPNHTLYSFCQQQRYAQRPLGGEGWEGEGESVRDALQRGWLMAREVLPFSYDGYLWVCTKAAQAQADLGKEDLIMIMRLGAEYRVRLTPFCENIENQILLRIHRDYEHQMLDYEEEIQKEMKDIFDKLETKSGDYFQILRQDGEEEGEMEEREEKQDNFQEKIQEMGSAVKRPLVNLSPEGESQKLIAELSQKLQKRTQRQFLLEDLIMVADLLRQWNSTNITLIQYLQQLLTVKLQKQKVQAPLALSYLKFLTYACQSLMREYQQHKDQYTARSVKRIYKYQYFYLQQHLRQLITSDNTATPQFVQALVQQYAAFPIKKRVIRKKIGIYVSSQINRLGMIQRDDIKTLLLTINGKDQKMNKQFREMLGLPQPQPQPKIQTAEVHQDQANQMAANQIAQSIPQEQSKRVSQAN